MEGCQEGIEPLDRAHDLASLSGEVEAVARGDRSMQQCQAMFVRAGPPCYGCNVSGLLVVCI